MGTETLHNLIIVRSNIRVKLNNPLMGTETLLHLIQVDLDIFSC